MPSRQQRAKGERLLFVADYRSRLEKVRLSDDMLAVWESYVRSAPYASDISFDDVVSAAVRLGNLVSA